MKKTKSVFFKINLIFLVFFLYGKEVYSLSYSDEKNILYTINEYFNLKYKILSTLVIDKEFERFIRESDGNISEKDILNLTVKERLVADVDLKFDNYTKDIKINSIIVNRDNATIDLIESHKIYFNCSPSVESSLNGKRHRISLIKENEQWYISEDNYYDDIKEEYDIYKRDNMERGSIDDFKRYYIDKTIKESSNDGYDKKIKCLDVERKEGKERFRTGEIEGNYNRKKAAEYAVSNGLTINSKYKNYEKLGGDCTNFSSQCIKEGGIPFDNLGPYKWFWYSDNKRTPSWTSANEFRKYAINNNRENSNNFGLIACETTFQDINLSDLVQFKDATHTMVVTGCIYQKEDKGDPWKNKKDILISQHSGSEIGRLVDYPLSVKPISKGRFFIKIKGYNK
ncbi:hypothetical protein JCM1393_23960 [Clostridium carnis]